jgi:plastocyanin
MAVALAITLTTVACGDNGPTDNGGTPTGDIAVGNNFFNPASFEATAGDEVVWAWNDGAATHNVTFDAGPPNSGDKSSGTFARTFATPGTFPYHCTIHGVAMSGTVTVVAAGGSAGGTGGQGGSGGGGGGGYGGAN